MFQLKNLNGAFAQYILNILTSKQGKYVALKAKYGKIAQSGDRVKAAAADYAKIPAAEKAALKEERTKYLATLKKSAKKTGKK